MFASSEEVCSISAHRRVLRRATRRRRKQRRLAACHPRSPTRAHPTLRPLPGRARARPSGRGSAHLLGGQTPPGRICAGCDHGADRDDGDCGDDTDDEACGDGVSNGLRNGHGARLPGRGEQPSSTGGVGRVSWATRRAGDDEAPRPSEGMGDGGLRIAVGGLVVGGREKDSQGRLPGAPMRGGDLSAASLRCSEGAWERTDPVHRRLHGEVNTLYRPRLG